MKSASQVSKSEVLLNIVGRMAHLDPCPMMIIQPTIGDAEDFSKSRLNKMIQDTKVLRGIFYERRGEPNQTILSKFFKGGRVILVGANSTNGLASRPIKILLCDEVDRYPPATKEGDPIRLATARTTTYFDAKIALFSTPTLKGISRIEFEYEGGTQEEWQHKCPNCGEYHALSYEDMQVEAQESSDAAGNRNVYVGSVKWRCPDCGFDFSEMEMKNSAQKYVAQNPTAMKNKVRSFFISGFSSPWLSWNNIIGEYLEVRGDASKEQVTVNTRFGKSYEAQEQETDAGSFLERREEYSSEVPEGVLLLTGAVDVQKNRLEYEIAGWNAATRYGILRGTILGVPTEKETWASLDAVLDKVYRFADGTGLKVSRTFIDSGYAATSVYQYCRENASKGRYAIKGLGTSGIPLLHKYSYPKGAGIILTILGVNDGKQEVLSCFDKWKYPKAEQSGYGENYYREMTAERKVLEKGRYVFEKRNKNERNESLDLAVYNLAAMRSCIGGCDEKEFWQRRYEGLRGEIKKAPARAKSREIDIWS